MEIRSKKEFFDLWAKGVLGNRTLLWYHILEIPADIKKIGFREIRKLGAGAGKWSLVERKDLEMEFQAWSDEGRTFIMDGSVPNDHSIMQGEVCRTIRGMESFLAIGYGLAPMRVTMAAGLHRHRGYVETLYLLNKYMDPSSRDDLDSIFELYPDATVEFTCFDIDTGNIPNRSTIFWEVRNY